MESRAVRKAFWSRSRPLSNLPLQTCFSGSRCDDISLADYVNGFDYLSWILLLAILSPWKLLMSHHCRSPSTNQNPAISDSHSNPPKKSIGILQCLFLSRPSSLQEKERGGKAKERAGERVRLNAIRTELSVTAAIYDHFSRSMNLSFIFFRVILESD